MKALILAAFVAFSLGASASAADPGPIAYQTPSHNYHQNNWMSS